MEKKTGKHGVECFLSERMLRTAAMVSRGTTVADVGCDHAYTSVYLIEQGIATGVVAMDVNKGPLAKARENVDKFGMQDKIDLRLSDGLEKLAPGEADTILIAGMGGPLMERILAAYPATLSKAKELVLQPQSEVASLRRFVQKQGFRITEEDMLKEDGKFYVMMHAVPTEETQQYEEACDYEYGKLLMEESNEVLKEFLERECRLRNDVLTALAGQETENACARRMALEEEFTLIRRAQERMK